MKHPGYLKLLQEEFSRIHSDLGEDFRLFLQDNPDLTGTEVPYALVADHQKQVRQFLVAASVALREAMDEEAEGVRRARQYTVQGMVDHTDGSGWRKERRARRDAERRREAAAAAQLRPRVPHPAGVRGAAEAALRGGVDGGREPRLSPGDYR